MDPERKLYGQKTKSSKEGGSDAQREEGWKKVGEIKRSKAAAGFQTR